jgi:hypothetical protein
MPKFQRFTATTTPRGSGLARAQNIGALTRSSDQEFYRSIGALSQGLEVASDYAFRAAEKRRAVDADIQYKKAGAEVNEYNFKFWQSMENVPIRSDSHRMELFQNYLKNLDDFNQSKNKEIDNKDALNAREADWPVQRYGLMKNTWSVLTRKLNDHQKSTVWSIGDSFIREGRIDEAKKHFQYHVDKGLITKANVDKFMAEKETYYEARQILIEKGYDAANDFVMSQDDIDIDAKKKVISDINFEAAQRQDRIEIQRERNRDEISKLIRSGQSATSAIENSALEEKEQWTWFERERAEAERLAKGTEIITDPKVRSELYSDIMGILTGATNKEDTLKKAFEARFDPKNPTLSEQDYNKIETAINAQYEEAYKSSMSKVQKIAEGTLLNPDSLGYIRNAPIRYKILGDFNEAWFKYISEQGENLKISDIYPEGRKLAAMYQISDEEAERQEEQMNLGLKKKEAKEKKLTPQIARRYFDIVGATNTATEEQLKEAKRLAAEDGYVE